MEIAALVVALFAAVFTGTQWLEARRSRQAGENANKLAQKAHELAQNAHELAALVESRQSREEERAAVTWRARQHPRFRGVIQFENTGHSAAYDVTLAPSDLAAVRHDRLYPTWQIEPGESYQLSVKNPLDLGDMPDSVRITFKLEEYSGEEKAQVVSLAGLMDDFRLIAAEDRKMRIEDPIRYEAEHSAYLRFRAEAVAAQESATTDQQPAATALPLSDVPAQPADPAEEPAPEQP